MLVGVQSSGVGELSSVSRSNIFISCQLLLVERLLQSDSYSLASVVGDFFFLVRLPYSISCQLFPGRQASVVRELLSGGWLCSFASCQLVAGRQAPVVRELLSGAWFGFSPFVSAVVARQASGVGESISGPSFD